MQVCVFIQKSVELETGNRQQTTDTCGTLPGHAPPMRGIPLFPNDIKKKETKHPKCDPTIWQISMNALKNIRNIVRVFAVFAGIGGERGYCNGIMMTLCCSRGCE